jgi:hypothetical protein
MFTFRRALVAAAAIVVVAALSATGAKATTWSLNESNGCSGGCTTGPFGTVDVTDNGLGTLSFDVELAAGYNFLGGSNIFTFNLSGGPTISYSNTSSNFLSGDTTPVTSGGGVAMDGFGKYMYAVDLNGSGGSTPQGASLTFDIFSAGLTLAAITTNDDGYLFAAHICSLSGCGSGLTGFAAGGPVTGGGGQNEVPLPAAVWLMGSVLAGGFGVGSWRRRKKRANPAS